MAFLNALQQKFLSEFLDAPRRPEQTMNLHEVRGFLWGVAASPVKHDIEQWLAFVFDGEEPNFRDAKEEKEVLVLLDGLWQEQRERIDSEQCELADPPYHWHTRPEQRWPLTDWCIGLLKAHCWQEDFWQELLQHTEPVITEDGVFDMQEEVDHTLTICSLIADYEAIYQESEDRQQLSDDILDFAEQLPWIALNYAECGQLLAELDSRQPQPLNKPALGRNEPCFCGSGKKYKHCCLRAANDE